MSWGFPVQVSAAWNRYVPSQVLDVVTPLALVVEASACLHRWCLRLEMAPTHVGGGWLFFANARQMHWASNHRFEWWMHTHGFRAEGRNFLGTSPGIEYRNASFIVGVFRRWAPPCRKTAGWWSQGSACLDPRSRPRRGNCSPEVPSEMAN